MEFLTDLFKKAPRGPTQKDVLLSLREKFPMYGRMNDDAFARAAAKNVPGAEFLADFKPDAPVPPEATPREFRDDAFYKSNPVLGTKDALSVIEKIKTAYPKYKDVDAKRLAKAVEAKYPEHPSVKGLYSRLVGTTESEPVSPAARPTNTFGDKREIISRPPSNGAPGDDRMLAMLTPAQKLFRSGVESFRLGDEQAAVGAWENVLRMDPGHAEAREVLERIRARNRPRAPVKPESSALYMTGVEAFRAGAGPAAKMAWERALAADPNNLEAREGLERLAMAPAKAPGAAQDRREGGQLPEEVTVGPLEGAVAALATGGAQTMAAVARMPNLVGQLQSLPINMTLKAAGLPEIKDPQVFESSARWWDEKAKEFDFGSRYWRGEKLKSLAKNKDPAEITKYVAYQVIKNAPQQVLFIGSFLAGAPGLSLAIAGGMSGASALAEGRAKEAGPTAAALNAALNGTIEASFERLGTLSIMQKWGKALAKSFGEKQARGMIVGVVKSIFDSAVQEGAEEGLTSLGQDFAQVITGVDKDAMKGSMGRAAEAAVIGGVSGGTMTAPAAIVSATAMPEAARRGGRAVPAEGIPPPASAPPAVPAAAPSPARPDPAAAPEIAAARAPVVVDIENDAIEPAWAFKPEVTRGAVLERARRNLGEALDVWAGEGRRPALADFMGPARGELEMERKGVAPVLVPKAKITSAETFAAAWEKAAPHIPKNQIKAAAELMDARAARWAEDTGRTRAEYFRSRFADVVNGDPAAGSREPVAPEEVLYQSDGDIDIDALPTARELTGAPSVGAIRRRLDDVFGGEREWEDVQYGDAPKTLRYVLGNAFQADIEHAARTRDVAEAAQLLDAVRRYAGLYRRLRGGDRAAVAEAQTELFALFQEDEGTGDMFPEVRRGVGETYERLIAEGRARGMTPPKARQYALGKMVTEKAAPADEPGARQRAFRGDPAKGFGVDTRGELFQEDDAPRAEFLGWNDSQGFGPNFPLYNVRGKHQLSGSTVSAATLRLEGIAVPETPAFEEWRKNPRKLFQHERGPVFYSQLQRVIQEKMPERATVEQVRNLLKSPGVKQDEVDWSGVEDFLKEKEAAPVSKGGSLSETSPKTVFSADSASFQSTPQRGETTVPIKAKAVVTKQEVLDFLRGNEVKVQEVVKGGMDSGSKKFPGYYKNGNWSDERVVYRNGKLKFSGGYEIYFEGVDDNNVYRDDEGNFWTTDGEDISVDPEKPEGKYPTITGKDMDTKFSSRKLPGGENYREVLLTLPVAPGHVSPQDIISGARKLADQRDWDWEKLSTGERQKLWNEASNLSKENPRFISSHFDEPNILAHVRMNNRTTTDDKKMLFLEEVQSDWGQALRAGKEAPPMPMSKTWHELALKRMLRYAVDNGYDSVGWTTGEQQAERYDLSKQVEDVRALKRDDGTYSIAVTKKDGSGLHIVNESAAEKDLPVIIGKDLATKVQAQEVGPIVKYSGVDLKVGGEGMKGFYDQILPSFVNKYTKKWGGRVGEAVLHDKGQDKIFGDEPYRVGKNMVVHSLSITPSMRESVKGGQPLFQGRPRTQPKAAVEFGGDMRALTKAFKRSDVSSIIHEGSHVFRRDLYRTLQEARPERLAALREDIAVLEKWTGMKGESWTREAEEKFARGFERYMATGEAPLAELRRIFERMARWFAEVYKSIQGSAIGAEVPAEVRRVFDRLFVADPESQAVQADIMGRARAMYKQSMAEREDAASRLSAFIRENGGVAQPGDRSMAEEYAGIPLNLKGDKPWDVMEQGAWDAGVLDRRTTLERGMNAIRPRGELPALADFVDEARREAEAESLPAGEAVLFQEGDEDVAGIETAIPGSVYAANRAADRPGFLRRAAKELGDARDDVKTGFFAKNLAPLSHLLKSIHPDLKRRMRRLEHEVAQKTSTDIRLIAPLIKAVRDRLSPEDRLDFDLARKNGDKAKIVGIVQRNGLQEEYARVRSVLEGLYNRAKAVGFDLGHRKEYHPRRIKDTKGFMEEMSKSENWSAIVQAIEAKIKELKRPLTLQEQAQLANNMLRGYGEKIALGRTGNMKKRKIDVIDAKLNKYYYDSDAALVSYVERVNEAIEARRFFGRGPEGAPPATLTDSIGSYTLGLVATGKISPVDEVRLREALQARFTPKEMGHWAQTYRDFSYLETIGSVSSALTQLEDLAMAWYRNGLLGGTVAAVRAAVGRSQVTAADLGINKISQEFRDGREVAGALERVLRLTGLEHMDKLGKNALIEAALRKYQDEARAGEFSPGNVRRIRAAFGEESSTQVEEDLAAGRITDDVKYLLFNDLLDVQPVAKSEMPEGYSSGGNLRLFWTLKNFTIKRVNFFLDESFRLMGDPKTRAEGIQNLFRLTAMMMMAGAGADALKDLVFRRYTSWHDRIFDNLLKLVGLTKFTIYEARQQGAGSAIMKMILPPAKMLDALWRDIIGWTPEKGFQGNVWKGKKWELPASIPILGKLYYWWFGKGAEKTERARRKATFSDYNEMKRGFVERREELKSDRGAARRLTAGERAEFRRQHGIVLSVERKRRAVKLLRAAGRNAEADKWEGSLLEDVAGVR